MTTPLDSFHAHEIRFGRGDWTYADYFAAGLRDADECRIVTQRRHHAECFVDFHVPPGSARRKAWVAEGKVELDAPVIETPQQAEAA